MLTKFDGFVKTPTEALEETALLDIKPTKKQVLTLIHKYLFWVGKDVSLFKNRFFERKTDNLWLEGKGQPGPLYVHQESRCFLDNNAIIT